MPRVGLAATNRRWPVRRPVLLRTLFAFARLRPLSCRLLTADLAWRAFARRGRLCARFFTRFFALLRLADVRLADMSLADLRLADLRLADLRLADLRLADLRLADLRLADLRLADLCLADLCLADLCLADLCFAEPRAPVLRLIPFRFVSRDFAALLS